MSNAARKLAKALRDMSEAAAEMALEVEANAVPKAPESATNAKPAISDVDRQRAKRALRRFGIGA